MNLRRHSGWIIAGAMVLMGAGYGSILVNGPSGTPLTNITCTAGCSQTGSTLDVNASGGGGYATVQDEGSALTQRTILNFAGAGVACADDTTRTTCTISGAAGSFYGTIQDEATPLTQRATVNFTGAGVSCVDNAGATRTDCTIPTVAPAGNTGEVQYNNGGAFAGAANVEISAAGNLNLVATTTPATPAAGIGTLYGKQRAGRVIPTMISPDGTQQTTQEAIFSNSIQIMLPNTGTTVPLAFGNTWTGRASTGTLSHPAIATTNHLTLNRQSLYTSGAVAGQGYGIQGTFNMNYLGNAANRGGFFFFTRFGFTAYSAAARVFIGLTTQNAAYGATEPSTVNNTVGLCKDSGDATVAFCMRGTAVTKNGTFTPAANTVYDFTMSAPPNSTTVTYRLVDETNGTVIFDNLSTSTNAPAVNTLMYPWTWVGASSAVSQIMAVMKVYVASDF